MTDPDGHYGNTMGAGTHCYGGPHSYYSSQFKKAQKCYENGFCPDRGSVFPSLQHLKVLGSIAQELSKICFHQQTLNSLLIACEVKLEGALYHCSLPRKFSVFDQKWQPIQLQIDFGPRFLHSCEESREVVRTLKGGSDRLVNSTGNFGKIRINDTCHISK